MLRRLYNECMLRPEDVPVSDPQLEVVGAFNPGAVLTDDGVVLLVRVAEQPKERVDGFMALPRWDQEAGLVVDQIPEADMIVHDPRVVEYRPTGDLRLTFISHIAVARSSDGRTIDRIEDARFVPENPWETYGVEDPRITPIDGRFYFTYVAVSEHGATTALASTEDFQAFERHGVIFACENKDVVLFPERVNGAYAAFHRPNPCMHFTPPAMWLAYSPDLVHWGKHTPFHAGGGHWETGRIGGGCPPIGVDEGWIEIYHGNEKVEGEVGTYAAGALLLDGNDPGRVLGRSQEPIMSPEADFECEGFVSKVVFPTGVIDRGDILQVYYGAADANLGVVEWSKQELVDSLTLTAWRSGTTAP